MRMSSLRSLVKITVVYNMLVTMVLLSIELQFKLSGSVIKFHYITLCFMADKLCVYKLLLTTDY